MSTDVSLLHMLRRASQAADYLFSTEVDDREITSRQFVVLQAIAAGDGVSQTDIVDRTGIDRSTIADVVMRLQKKGHVVRFLEAGSKVKVTIMFRGREQSRPELGYRLLKRLGADVADYGFVETSAKQDGRNMTMVLAPHRGAKTRARARHPEEEPGAEPVRDSGVADDSPN